MDPVFARYDLGGNQVLDPRSTNFLGSCDWAQRPDASQVPIRSEIIVTDVGAGGRSSWFSDGEYWRPVNGRVLLWQKHATLAAPLATLTAAGIIKDFVLSETLAIPAGMLFPGALVGTSCHIRRLGAAGAAGSTRVGLGPNINTTANAYLNSNTIPAVLNADWLGYGWASVVSSTAYVTGTAYIAMNSSATNALSDRLNTLDAAQPNYISFGVHSSATIDQFALTRYSVWLEV